MLLLVRHDLRAIRWLLVLAVAAGATALTRAGSWDPLNPLAAWTLPVAFVLCGLVWFFIAGRLAFQHPAADPLAAWRLRPVAPWMVIVEKIGFGVLLLAVIPALVMGIKSAWAGMTRSPGDAGVLSLALDFTTDVLVGCTSIYLALLWLASLCRTSGSFLLVLAGGYFLGSSVIGALIVWFPGLSTRVDASYQWLAWLVYTGGMIGLIARQYVRPRLGRSLVGAALLLGLLFGLAQVVPGVRGPRLLAVPDASVSIRLEGGDASGARPFSVQVTGLPESDVWCLRLGRAAHRSRVTRIDGNTGNSVQTPVLVETPALRLALGLEDFRLVGALVEDARVWSYLPDPRRSVAPSDAVVEAPDSAEEIVVMAATGGSVSASRVAPAAIVRAVAYRTSLSAPRLMPLRKGARALGAAGDLELLELDRQGRRLSVTVQMDRGTRTDWSWAPGMLAAWVDTQGRTAYLADVTVPAGSPGLRREDGKIHLSLIVPSGAAEPDELRFYERTWTGYFILPVQASPP
ncbi:MAG TPA: hypothetical protein PKX00_01965 [Opitutaceae bacterium]|nr:hypothetical protein [Opitutaceae bacterium]